MSTEGQRAARREDGHYYYQRAKRLHRCCFCGADAKPKPSGGYYTQCISIHAPHAGSDAKLMIRAFCLTESLHFKEITKKETRIQKSIAIAHEYSQKIINKQLSKEEYNLLLEIDKELDRFSAAKMKEEETEHEHS